MTAATGGVVTNIVLDGISYRVHTFNQDDDFIVTEPGEIEYLLVAGGGSGGVVMSATYSAGGGGAGGLLHNVGAPETISAGTFPVIVGVGGAGVASSNTDEGMPGTDSSFNTLTAIGGGAGCPSYNSSGAKHGGSGGGGGCAWNTTYYSYPGTGVSGQGHGGGKYYNGSDRHGGGGGGAGGVGGVAQGAPLYTSTAVGGPGVQNTITGEAIYYAGGGGGVGNKANDSSNAYYTNYVAAGGLGGGGASHSPILPADPCIDGLGGGSGAANGEPSTKGGDGVVVIRYVSVPNHALSPVATTSSSPSITAPSIKQSHSATAIAIEAAGVAFIEGTSLTQKHLLGGSVIWGPTIVSAPICVPAPMPTEIRVTLYDAAGNTYPDGTKVHVYNADGAFYETTTVGSITGYNVGVYPLASEGQVVTRFAYGDQQQRFFVLAPDTDMDGLVTNLLTAVQLVAGEE